MEGTYLSRRMQYIRHTRVSSVCSRSSVAAVERRGVRVINRPPFSIREHTQNTGKRRPRRRPVASTQTPAQIIFGHVLRTLRRQLVHTFTPLFSFLSYSQLSRDASFVGETFSPRDTTGAKEAGQRSTTVMMLLRRGRNIVLLLAPRPRRERAAGGTSVGRMLRGRTTRTISGGGGGSGSRKIHPGLLPSSQTDSLATLLLWALCFFMPTSGRSAETHPVEAGKVSLVVLTLI